MADNKITIGKEKQKKTSTDELELLKKGELYLPEKGTEDTPLPAEPQTLDDNLWGNDWQINKLIDKDYLAEKRLFVRVRYFRHIDCKMRCPDYDAEPEKLDRPIHLTVFDLSMGGIGAICATPVSKDDILAFNLQLDHMNYNIKCQTVYCLPVDNVYRLGFRILTKDKDFIKHLKIFVARLSLIGSKVSFDEIVAKFAQGVK